MTKRYQSISLDDAEEGMILYNDVIDRQENVLLPEGTALTASLIRSLTRRGIESVLVVDDSISPEELAAERERVAARLAHLFRKCDTNACESLRLQVEKYRMEALS